MKKLIFPLYLLLVILTGCQVTPETGHPLLATSIEPLRYLVEQIAGDRYEVLSLTPAGVSPETYEPTPQQLVSLSHAEVYFSIGTLGFEQTKLKKMVEETPQLQLCQLTDSIELLPASCSHDHGNATNNHATTDLHIWMSSKNMKRMGKYVCAELSKRDSAHATYYAERLRKFEAKADSIDEVIRTTLKPLASRTFVIYHPALAYFAREYGLTQLSLETDGKEPTPQVMASLIATCKANRVKTIFVQQEYSGKMAERLATELGLQIVRIHPLAHDWDKEIVRIAKSFK